MENRKECLKESKGFERFESQQAQTAKALPL
jgi:hypothetical protein